MWAIDVAIDLKKKRTLTLKQYVDDLFRLLLSHYTRTLSSWNEED